MPKPNGWESYKQIPDFYNRVRSVVGANSDTLSDEYLDFFEYSPYAEFKIESTINNWSSISDSLWPLFESCIVIKTAINVKQSADIQNIKSQQTPNLRLEYFENSDVKLGLSLENLLQDMIDTILQSDNAKITKFIVT